MGSGQRKEAEKLTQTQAGIAKEQAGMAKDIGEQAMPWTTVAGKYYQDILKGGDALTKAVAPQIGAVTQQYGAARQKAKEMPLGGSRDRSMRDISIGEASTKSSIYSGGVNDAILRLAAMGESGTAASMGGYSGASGNMANAADMYSRMAQGKGSAAGGLASAGGGIAAAAIAA